MVDPDQRVADNYTRLALSVLDMAFDQTRTLTNKHMREELVADLGLSMKSIFGDIKLSGLGRPTENGTFVFDKGESREFEYVNLSGGEKAAFDVLLDIVVRRIAYADSVYCIDEPELHMNTRAQASLLNEMFRLTPSNSQLWIATHSIGMLRVARDIERKSPGSVVFIDLDTHNFDEPVVLKPTTPDRRFWLRLLDVALGDLAHLVAPEILVLCEGEPGLEGDTPRSDFDADCYRTIFGSEMPNVAFLSAGDARAVGNDRL